MLSKIINILLTAFLVVACVISILDICGFLEVPDLGYLTCWMIYGTGLFVMAVGND